MQAARALLAFTAVENAGQSKHVALPLAGLYVPAPHAAQVVAFSPVYPTSHMQEARAVLAANAVENAGQSKQAALPLAGLYVPVPHAPHVATPSPVYPGSHMQAVLAADEVENAGQSTHAEFPTKLLYFPATHCTHTSVDSVHPLLQLHAEYTILRSNTFNLIIHQFWPVLVFTNLSRVSTGMLPAS